MCARTAAAEGSASAAGVTNAEEAGLVMEISAEELQSLMDDQFLYLPDIGN